MKATLFLTVIFLGIVRGWYYTICPTHPVEAEEGDDVTLQGRLDPSINLVNYTVDFKRTDLNKVVHCYRHGKDDHDPQMEQYRFRTTLSHEDLSRGVLTLQISSVRLSDSGPYKAFVPKLMASCIISLSVGAGKMMGDRAGIISTVVIVFIFCLSCLGVLVLRKGPIWHRRRAEQRPETLASSFEMNSTCGDITQHST